MDNKDTPEKNDTCYFEDVAKVESASPPLDSDDDPKVGPSIGALARRTKSQSR